MRRLGVVLATTATSMVMIGGVASAHECFIENRSDRGDAMAGEHSGNWVSEPIQGFAEFLATQIPGLDADCFVDVWLEGGGPAQLTINMSKTIGDGSKNPNVANGKGLEYASVAFEDLTGAAIGACT